jgi:HAAS domain-containing protein
MTGSTGAPPDLVEDYLDRLLVSLSSSPREIRHTLAEVEAHLRDAVAQEMTAGLTEPQAQARAVERMGPVHTVTGRPAVLARPSTALLRRLALTAALVGGAGLAAIGGGGLIGWVLGTFRGNAFMTAPWPAGTYTGADCARWLAGDPGTRSCVTAMLADHMGDFLLQATTCGLLGLACLAVFLVLARRWRDRATLAALPAGTAQALGAACAGLAAVALSGLAADIEIVQHGIGAGEPLSLALAAAAAAACFALWLWRILRGSVTTKGVNRASTL